MPGTYITAHFPRSLAIVLAGLLAVGTSANGQNADSAAFDPGARQPIAPASFKTDANNDTAADAINAFGFDLYAKLRTANGGNDNLFFSPYSLSSALAMTRLGAHGITADQMSSTLHLPADVSDVEQGYHALNDQLSHVAQKEGYALDVANSLWTEKGEPILPDFSDAVKKYFSADITPVDFAGQTEACRKQINDWASAQTKGKIENLLLPGSVTTQTRLVLANAIYFKGKWESPFDRAQTKQLNFTGFAGRIIPTDYMQISTPFPFTQDTNCQAVLLPYAGNQIGMLLLVPKVKFAAETDRTRDVYRSALEQLEGALNAGYIRQLMGRMVGTPVKLALPKWKAGQSFDLGSTLAEMGMKQAFSADADFTGITPQRGLFLSDVVHKAVVQVDEQGTEAAAASAVLAPGAALPSGPPVNVFADHPYVYLIVHVPSRTILFAGRMCDPSAVQ